MNKKFIENILSSSKILYLEDDSKYCDNVSEALKIKVESVFIAKTIKEAASIYNTEHIDIIISEFTINSGLTTKFITQIRSINKNIPIIIISSVKDINLIRDIIKFNLTDYIFKPIDIKILKEALNTSVISIYDSGLFQVNFENGTKYDVRKKLLTLNDEILTLTINEVRLLDVLVFNRQSLLTKDTLKDMIWEDPYDISDEALKSLMTRLRKKIGKESIQNISGSGYILSPK